MNIRGDMMKFSGKKLMVIGECSSLVRTANEMGVYTVAAGYYEGTNTKKIASKKYDINPLVVDELVEVANIENIDGIMLGIRDIYLNSYLKVCERVGLPCYANEMAIRYLTDKSLFKEQLQKVGLPVIPEYQDSDEFISGNYEQIPLPVVTKPVDSAGGKGISIVKSLCELQKGIDKALDRSFSKKIQIEKYMQGDIIACYYTIIDGKVYISSVEDNLFTKLQGNLCPVTTGHIYVSKHIDMYMEKAHDKICALLNGIGVMNGVLQINAFVENGEFYFYDPGYRLQGEAQYHILHVVNGFDHKRMLTEFAFTGSMGCPEFPALNDPYLRGKNAVSMWVLLKQGTIGKINGVEVIRDCNSVIYMGQNIYEGDVVNERMLGTEAQVFSRIYIVSNEKKEIVDTVRKIRENLIILDTDGNDMILDALSL